MERGRVSNEQKATRRPKKQGYRKPSDTNVKLLQRYLANEEKQQKAKTK
jgi:hypothetical protein